MRPEDEYRLRSRQMSGEQPFAAQSASQEYEPERKRPGCLTIWLGAIIVLSPISIFMLLPYLNRLLRVAPLPTLVLVGSIIAQAVTAYYLYHWKRWAITAFIAVMVVTFVLQVFIRVAEIKDFVQILVALGILYYFVQPHIDDYD